MPDCFAFDDESDIEVAEEESNQPQSPTRQPEFFHFDDDSYDKTAQELLTNAARLGDVEEVKTLLQARGRQPLGKTGDVPLSEAVRAGHVTVVALLLLGMADPGSGVPAAVEAPSTPATTLVLLASRADPEDEKARRQRMVFLALDECMRFLVGWLLRKLGVNLAVRNVLSDAQWDAACEAEAQTAHASQAAQAGPAPPQADPPASQSQEAQRACSRAQRVSFAEQESEQLAEEAQSPCLPSEEASPAPPPGSPANSETWYESVPGSRCIEVRDAPATDAAVLSSLPVPTASSVCLCGVPCDVKGILWLRLSLRSQEMLGFPDTPLWTLIDRGSGAPALLRLTGTAEEEPPRKTACSERPPPATATTPSSSSSTSGRQPRADRGISEVAEDQPSPRSSVSKEAAMPNVMPSRSSSNSQPDVAHESNGPNDTLDDAGDRRPKALHKDEEGRSGPSRQDTARSKFPASNGPANESTGMPCGPQAFYEVLHSPRVAVRDMPTMDGDILTVFSQGSRVIGNPHEVRGLPWLKLSSETCVECDLTKDQDAWVLIDGRSPNLGVLLQKMGTAGDIKVLLSGGRPRKPTGWARASAPASPAGSTLPVPPLPVSSSSSSTVTGAKPKGSGAVPLASPASYPKPRPDWADGPTDVKPMDSDGQYEVLQSRSAVRDAPEKAGNIQGVAKQGQKLCGTPYLIHGMPWLRLDPQSALQIGLDEDSEEGAWVLIDGTSIGHGVLLKRLGDSCKVRGDEEDLRLDGTEEWVKQWQEWYAVELAKPENSHLPVDKLDGYSKQLDEAICSNNGMLVKSLLQTRGQLCRAHGAFDLAREDLKLAATMHPEDAAVLFECGIARLEAGGKDSASKALSDFRAAQFFKLDPKYASSKTLESWIQRAKHWSLDPDRPNHYRTLGVQIDATPEQLKKARNAAMLRWHPDKGGDAERCREAHQAWQVLKSPDLRRAYDFGEGQAISQPRGKARPKSRPASKS